MSTQTQKEATFELIAYEQKWVESLNRGDVAAGGRSFCRRLCDPYHWW